MKRLFADQAGAAAIEYAMLAALIAVTLVGALLAVGRGFSQDMEDVQTSVAHRIVVRR